MLTSVLLTWTHPTYTSKLVCSCFKMGNLLLAHPMAMHPYPKTSIPKRTSLLPFMDRLLPNGAHPNLSSHRRAQLHQLLVEVDGTDL